MRQEFPVAFNLQSCNLGISKITPSPHPFLSESNFVAATKMLSLWGNCIVHVRQAAVTMELETNMPEVRATLHVIIANNYNSIGVYSIIPTGSAKTKTSALKTCWKQATTMAFMLSIIHPGLFPYHRLCFCHAAGIIGGPSSFLVPVGG